MSRTIKDMRFLGKYAQDKMIAHDHTDGRCVVGTMADDRYLRTKMNKHHASDECKRHVTTTLCIHNDERDRYEHLLKNQLVRHTSILGSGYKISDLILEMKRKNYLPWCSETKTHQRDREEFNQVLDFRLTGMIGSVHMWMLRLKKGYDKSIPCEVCETLEKETVTCFYETYNQKKNYKRRVDNKRTHVRLDDKRTRLHR